MTSLPELLEQPRDQLLQILLQRGLSLRPNLLQQELVKELVLDMLDQGETVTTDGILTVLPDGFGFIRMVSNSFEPTPIDAYVSPSQIHRLNLQPGHRIKGPLRAPHGTEQFFALMKVDLVQGRGPEELHNVTVFAARTPVPASRALPMCGADGAKDLRFAQALAPMRFGHRVLVHAPTSWPRFLFLTRMAAELRQQHEDAVITLCLLDQRPEDIASAGSHLDSSGCELVSTAFAAEPQRHTTVADVALNCAQRHVEQGRDTILLIDSLTALTRAHSRSTAPSGSWIRPGLDAKAIQPAKRLLASAQQCAEGGSMTIIATVQQGAPGTIDDAIERELAPCTNSDIVIATDLENDEQELPFDVLATCTRKADDPTSRPDRQRMLNLRNELATLPPSDRAAHWSQLLQN